MRKEEGRKAVSMLWSTPEVKQLNKERIRKAIQENGKCTKSKIAKMTNLSVATSNNALNEMVEAGEIIKTDQEEIIMGRPADRFIYNSEYHHVLGVCISINGSEKISCAVGDALGKELEKEEKTLDEITYEDVEAMILEMLEKDSLVNSISVGIPGVTHDGIIERCDIPTLVGIPMEERLKEKTGMDVVVKNDMEYFAESLYYSSYSGKKNIAVAYFPEGNDAYVGCGFVVNGKIVKGASRFSGELSYVPQAFGISFEEQKRLMENRDTFVDYVSKIVLTIISTIDPEEIFLMGHDLTDEECKEVRAKCIDVVTEKHVPKMAVENDIDGTYTTGMIRAAVNRMDFPLSGML